jgi:urease accessory protein
MRAARSRILILILFALLSPAAAYGHLESGSAAGFVSGLSHPVSGMDHVLAMVAVGLWGAQLGAPAVWVLPVAFPMVMAFGGTLGLLGFRLPGVEVGIALSALMLGVMICWERRPPLAVSVMLVGIFAVFHGHAHGTELPEGASGMLYSIGFVIATGLLHATGIAIGLVHRWYVGKLALRLAGAAVAVGGLVFLWNSIA